MSTELPGIVAEHIAAVNAFDTERIVATFAPRVASAARKAATVSGPAGRAATRLASHQERNKAKSDRYANQTNA